MTLNEAIEVYKHPTQYFSGEHREADKIAIQSMKELKLLRAELKSHILYDKELAETKMFQLGYNKAIDDFVKFANTMPTVEEEDGTIRPMRLEEMAEQLKVGVKNE